MKKYIIVITLFIAISIYLSITNLGLKTQYAGGDAGAVYILPIEAFKQSIYTWYEMCNAGTEGRINLPRLFPFLTLVSILKCVGISTSIIQRLLFSLYIFMPALSMLILLLYLSKEDFKGRLIVLSLGSLFYAVNHFTMVILSHPIGIGELFVFYLVLPILFLSFIKGLKGENPVKYSICFSLLFALSLPGNMAYTGLVVFLLGFYFLWCLIAQRNYRQMLKFILYAIGFSIIFSLWFIVPYGDFIIKSSKGLEEIAWLGKIDYLKILNTRNSLKNVLALCGEIWDNPQDIASLKPLHDNLLYIKLKYIIPLLSLSAILWCRKKKDVVLFFILALLSIFFAKGINPPFGSFFMWLYKYVPVWSIYRNAYDKFSMLVAFSYAILATISLRYLIKHITKRIGRIAVHITCYISLIVSSGLFWQGKVVRWPNFFVRIPGSYYDAQKWINSQKEDSKILTFPIALRRMKKLNWGYMGVDLFELLFNKPVLNYYDLCQKLGSIQNWILKKEHLPAILKIFNIGYILLDTNQENLHEEGEKEKVIKRYEAIFRKRLSQFLNKEERFNGLGLYKVKKHYPHIYTSISPVFILGNLSMLELICTKKYLGGNPLILFSKQNRKLFENKRLLEETGLVGVMNRRLPIQTLNNIKSKIVYSLLGDIKQRMLYIKESGKYLFRFKLIPKYISKKGLSSTIIEFPNYVDKISVTNHNTSGRYLIDGLGRLITSIYFDGGHSEDEYFQIKIKDLDIDLAKLPWIILEYKIEDISTQIVELVVGVDINGDGITDEYLRGMHCKSPSAGFCKFYHNLYHRIKAKYPNLENPVVREIELYPHKYWGADCSTLKKKKYYRFWIKNLEFCNGYRKPGVLEFENVGFEEKINKLLFHQKNIRFSREFDNLDISRYPFMELGYKVNNIWTTGLDIIFEFTDKENGITKIIKLNSIFPWQDGLCKETLDILSLMHKNNLDEKTWLLKRIEFNFYKKTRSNKTVNINLGRLGFYNIKYKRAGEFGIDREILKIDNHTIRVKKSFKNTKIVKDGIEFSKEIYLEKGMHKLKNLITDWSPFKLEWVFIEPVIEEPILKQLGTLPEITCKKINPTRYIISVITKNPFWLVFSESFNPQWRAYASESENSAQKIELKNHFMINGYSNGWYISGEDISSLYDGKTEKEYKMKIVITYAPQTTFKMCTLISVASLISVFIVLLLRKKFL